MNTDHTTLFPKVRLIHPFWTDTLLEEAPCRVRRKSNGDRASVLHRNEQDLVLKWDRWGTELFTRIRSGEYMLNDLPSPLAAPFRVPMSPRKDLAFVSFWHHEADILPDLAACSIRSFLRHGYDFHLFTYKKFGNIPEGTVLHDARDIMDLSEVYIHHSGSLAPFSDIFRLKLAATLHAAWTDMDNICLKAEFPDRDMLFYQENGRIVIPFFHFGTSEKGKAIVAAVQELVEHPDADMPWDSPALLRAKREMRKRSTLREKRILAPWNFFGSELYTSLGAYFGFLGKAMDFRSMINPYHFTEIYKLYVFPESEAMRSRMANVHLLALSTDLLRREPFILQNMRDDSFVSNLCRQFA